MEDKIIMKGCFCMEIREDIFILDNRGCKWYEGEYCFMETVKGDTIKGQIIAINPKTNLIMINPPNKYVEILSINDIKSIYR